MCTRPADICLIIDSSGSITDNAADNWRLLREFVASLIDYFIVGADQTRFGCVVFSEVVRLEFGLDRYFDSEQIKRQLLALRHLGQETNTPEALRVARQQCFNTANGDRPNVQNVAIVISDGVPYPINRRQPAINEAQVLRSFGTRMIGVGIGDEIDVDFLKTLSSQPQQENQDYFRSADFTALSMISRSVAEVSCVVPTPGNNLI